MRANMHAHTTFSDGALAPEELVRAALERGITHLAITDHFETSKLPRGCSVRPEQFDEYVDRLRALGAKYASGITLYVGLEVDFSARTEALDALGTGPRGRLAVEKLDLLLMEYVGRPDLGGAPLATLLATRRDWPCATGLAHTELPLAFGDIAPKELLAALCENDIFVELAASDRHGRLAPAQKGVDVAETLDELARLDRIRDDLARQRDLGPGDETQRIVSEKQAALQAKLRFVPYYREDVEYNNSFYSRAADSDLIVSTSTDIHALNDVDGMLDDAIEFLAERRLTDHLITRRLQPRAPERMR